MDDEELTNGADDSEPGADDSEPGAGDSEPGADDSEPGAGDNVPGIEIGHFYHVFECVRLRRVNGEIVRDRYLLRSFRVEEGDFSHNHTDMTRQIIGKLVVAKPDGNFDFSCYLSDVESMIIRHEVNVYYTYPAE